MSRSFPLFKRSRSVRTPSSPSAATLTTPEGLEPASDNPDPEPQTTSSTKSFRNTKDSPADYALSTSYVLLTQLQSVAGLTPVPFLKEAAGVACQLLQMLIVSRVEHSTSFLD